MRIRQSLALALFTLVAIHQAIAQKAPEDALKALIVRDGLEVTLFASEPMMANPCCFDVDAKGRAWVCEGRNYRGSKLAPEGDCIRVLEDTDGDGKADKATVFYQGHEVNSALGICVLGDKVVVCSSPYLYIFEDKNGDLKADGPPRIIFGGIGGHNNDHGLHSAVLGPDGKLYFNHGNAGGGIKSADGKTRLKDLAGNEVATHGKPYRQGMVYRCNLDGSQLETLGWNFRNNYEVCVDSFGNLWQSDNDDDGNRGVRINYVMEFGNFGYTDEMTGAGWTDAWRKAELRRVPGEDKVMYEWHQHDPGVVPNLLHTGAGSPTGICVYEGRLLPKIFWDQIIHADAGPNVVRAYPATPDGAGFKATSEDILTTKTDRWFRPSDVCVAPDGSLLVADWCDSGVGGHGTGDKDPDKVRGRVFRIAPPGVKYTIPKLDLSSAAGACAALASPNLAARALGHAKLAELGASAESDLAKLWDRKDQPRLRARALYLLARIPGLQDKYLRQALADTDANLRIVALRIAWEAQMDMVSLANALADDPSPAVRRQAAIFLRGNTSAAMPQAWAKLAARHDGKDRWYLEALGIGAAGRDTECFDAFLRQTNDKADHASFRDIAWRLRGEQNAAIIARLAVDPNLSPEQRIAFFRAFDFQPEKSRNAALLAILDSNPADQTVLIETLFRLKNLDKNRAPAVKQRINQILDALRGTPMLVQVVEQFDIRDRGADLLAYVIQNPTDLGVGAALRLILKYEPVVLQKALAGPDATRVAAALANATDHTIIDMLRNLAADRKKEIALRQSALTALSRSKNGCRAILDLEKNKKLPDDVRSMAGSLLHISNHKDIRADAAKFFPQVTAKDAVKIPPVEQLISMKGDAARGQKLFTTATCNTCHLINGQGTSYGPELSEIGDKLTREAFFQSVLYPNAAISLGFEGTIIATKDGDDFDGIITSETPQQIVLRRAGGINTPILKSEVAERRPMKLSIMPENLANQLTTQDLVDLVEYLTTLKKPQSAPARN